MKKSSKKNNTTWIYGRHAVFGAINNKSRKILKLLLLDSQNFDEHLKGFSIEYADRKVFEELFPNVQTQGIAALVEKLPAQTLEDLIKDSRPIIMLDQLNDPQNLGSILRAAAVFDAQGIITLEKNAADLTPTAIKIASGAAEITPVVKVVNLSHTIKVLKDNGFWIFGLDERAPKNISEVDLKEKAVIIIGSEGNGLRRLTKENCDFLVKIPASKNFSTLNAAQATTTVLYESFKQRN